MPRVSVVIPCYNTGQYLAEAIQSVLDQTYRDWELIVVDDGSTDNTREIAYSFSDPRIRYVYQENRGLSAARNMGIHSSQGEFLQFLDADDLILPAKFEQQVKLLDAHPQYGLVYSQSRYLQDGHLDTICCECTPSGNVLSELVAENLFPVHAALIRRACFEHAGLFCEELTAGGEDRDMWLRMAYAGILFLFHDDLLALYRRRPGSMMANWEGHQRNMVRVFERLCDLVRDKKILDRIQWAHHASRHYVLWALSLFQVGQCEMAQECLQKAFSLDEGWSNRTDELIKLIVEHSLHLFSTSGQAQEQKDWLTGLDYIDTVCKNLLSFLGQNRLAQRARGLFWVASAFKAHQAGEPDQVRASFWHAVLADPGCVRNLGLISVLLQSYLGVSLWKKLQPFRERLMGGKRVFTCTSLEP